MEYDKAKAKEADTPYSSSMLARAKLLGNQSMLECQCIQRVGDAVEDSYKIVELSDVETDMADLYNVLGNEKSIVESWFEKTRDLLYNIKEWVESRQAVGDYNPGLSEQEMQQIRGFREKIEEIVRYQLPGDSGSKTSVVNMIRHQLFNLARSLIHYLRNDTFESRALCYTLIYNILLSISSFIPTDGMMDYKYEFMVSDEVMEEIDDSQDLIEIRAVYSLIDKMEQYEKSIKRIPFCTKIVNSMGVKSGENRCHRIPYEYLKIGIFTPLIDAISALLRYMVRREEEMPWYSNPFELYKALQGVLLAAFPGCDEWEGADEKLTQLSKELYKNAQNSIDLLNENYGELRDFAMTRTVLEIQYENIERLLDLAKELLGIVNSSPQNLLVGNAITNKSINAALDIWADVSTPTLKEGSYAEQLYDLSFISGHFDRDTIHCVEAGSLTNRALIALLTIMDMGDFEIITYSGIQGVEGTPAMQSSDRPGMKDAVMKEDFIPFAVPLSGVISEHDILAEYLDLELSELPQYFLFRTSKSGESISQKGLRLPKRENLIKSRTLSELEEAAEESRFESETAEYIGNGLERLGYKVSSASEKGDNGFFNAIYKNLIRELIQNGIVPPFSAPPVEALIKYTQEKIGSLSDWIESDEMFSQSDIESAQAADLPLLPLGSRVLNEIVAFFEAPFQINLEVIEPNYSQSEKNQESVVRRNIESDAVPDGPVIFLHVFFYGGSRFQSIEHITLG